jgi:hypothetical protein
MKILLVLAVIVVLASLVPRQAEAPAATHRSTSTLAPGASAAGMTA